MSLHSGSLYGATAGGGYGNGDAAAAERTAHSTVNLSLSFGFTGALEGGAHPAWGPAASATKALSAGEPGTGQLLGGAAADLNGNHQVSKWGFVPGDEDTTDLNLERNGEKPYGHLVDTHHLTWCA
jgi:hypothetical protein